MEKIVDVDVTVECPEILNVGEWRKFVLNNFQCNLKYEEDAPYLEVTYDLTKLYDISGKRSSCGANYTYILYRNDGSIESLGRKHRSGSLKIGQMLKQTLKIYLKDIDEKYKLVIEE